jgi:RNA polymerase-binding transcription factor
MPQPPPTGSPALPGGTLPPSPGCQDGEMNDSVAVTLDEKRAQLEAELDGLSAPTDQGGISFGKRVGDGTSVAVERLSQVAAHDRLHAMLADVKRAQQKNAEGDYGTCDRCGSPIAPERLEALPWAVQCVQCAGRR